jgi:hypothetical protein
MRPSRGAQLVVWGLALAPSSIAARAWAAPACGPSALLEGDDPSLGAVARELEQLGIATAPSPECASVRVRIEGTPSGLTVRIVDAYGRSSERVTSGPAAAATLVESWARTAVLAPLLPRRAAERPPDRPVAAEAPAIAAPGVAPRSRGGREVSLAASAETSVATDRSLWVGVTAGVCMTVGRACAGVLARVSVDSEASGDSHARDSDRLESDVLLGVWLPLRFGRLTLAPGLAFGVGWLRTSAAHTTSADGDPVDADAGGLRASASVRLSVAVTPTLAVDLGLATDVAPLAHTGPYATDAVVLAGEPFAYLRGGLGLRWASP